jgi:hypothetical protein
MSGFAIGAITGDHCCAYAAAFSEYSNASEMQGSTWSAQPKETSTDCVRITLDRLVRYFARSFVAHFSLNCYSAALILEQQQLIVT